MTARRCRTSPYCHTLKVAENDSQECDGRKQMIHEGEILGGTYQVMKQIGRGGTGLVFLAYHRNLRKYVVVKRVQSGLANIESLRAETDILKNLHDSHIPQVYDFVVRDGEVFTVMDFIEGTSFDQLPAGTGRLSEAFLVNLLLQMGKTLSYLHRNKPAVIHSDIKPDNLILKPDGEICLIDFNISVSAAAPSSLSGYTMHFASPEQCQRSMEYQMGKRNLLTLDARTDIYSTGALFYYLITGLYPDTRRPKGTPASPSGRTAGMGGPYQNDTGLLYRDMISRGYSDAFCRLITKCLTPDRRFRYADGSKLYTAVRHLRRQDRRFQRYILLRAGSWILSAMLVGSGSWFLFRGMKQKVVEDYAAAWEQFESYRRDRAEASAAEAGLSILNETRFEGILSENPGNGAEIMRCLGDNSYNRRQYELASEYYGLALEYAQKAGQAASRYYRDYAVALVADGKLRKAERVLEEASSRSEASGRGIDESDSLYVQAYIMLNGDEPDADACIQVVNEILLSSQDNDLRARACVLASDASARNNNEEEQMLWLQKAEEYSGDMKYQQMVAAALLDQSKDTRRSGDQRRQSAKDASDIYKKIADSYSASLDLQLDYINVLQYTAGFYTGEGANRLLEESLRRLRTLERSYSSDYRIPMYMAFAYDKTGHSDRASDYARAALKIYESLTYEEQYGSDREAIEYLKELQ